MQFVRRKLHANPEYINEILAGINLLLPFAFVRLNIIVFVIKL